MIRKISLFLLITGFSVSVYYSFQYYQAKQSVEELPETLQNKPDENNGGGLQEGIEGLGDSEKKVEINPSTLEQDIETGLEIATLDIPALNQSFTTYWGTDENTLRQGVGLYVSEWTTVPNRERGHTVLSGHRDTVFTGLGELGKGDTLEIQYNGQHFQYEIEDTWITDADDRTVIVKKDEPTLTLTTCYPFNYIGNAPDRYIVQATLVD